jgi:hypothetical protein
MILGGDQRCSMGNVTTELDRRIPPSGRKGIYVMGNGEVHFVWDLFFGDVSSYKNSNYCERG